jgi:hypothetical protein
VTSSSLNTTIQSLDSLVARFKPGTPPVNAAADPRAPAVAKPPLISQYADALRELANTTEELQKLVVTLDDRSGGVERLVHSASADAKELARYLLVLILLLTLGLAAIIVAAVLATRRIGAALRG